MVDFNDSKIHVHDDTIFHEKCNNYLDTHVYPCVYVCVNVCTRACVYKNIYKNISNVYILKVVL